ncbi:hypothetical protein HNQ77_004065 [Silvibacterium bohemicum]|uniref:Uncharacterized protein n=1 Tax=Silvibacterium bohemicum TaxID=1577686 RepID=A0A841JZL7_9BACT|nr:hypothetical protein [Silvibacterium bohemicum]
MATAHTNSQQLSIANVGEAKKRVAKKRRQKSDSLNAG